LLLAQVEHLFEENGFLEHLSYFIDVWLVRLAIDVNEDEELLNVQRVVVAVGVGE
jgi:hypothetical protein